MIIFVDDECFESPKADRAGRRAQVIKLNAASEVNNMNIKLKTEWLLFANDGLLQAYASKILVNEGKMLDNDGEISV